MNESARTGVFVVIAAVFLLVAFVARPAAPEREAFDDSGERFFDEADPLEARSLEVVSFDEDTAEVKTFKVAHQDGRWSIPSHENYPADAEDHLANAAASVIDLVKGPKVSDRPSDHQLHGVLDPTSEETEGEGVGTRVTIQDGAGNTMADFIVGKVLRDSQNVRYVRVPERDRVYTATIDTTYLSTQFKDWIEEDLLKLDPWNIRQIVINDYTVDEVNQRILQGDLIDLTYDDETSTWSLNDLSEVEQIKTTAVNDLKSALDTLEIVNVHRKPAGLSGELRTEETLQLDAQAVLSLRARGFYIANNQLVSNQGETVVHMNDGVVYALRFGEIALADDGDTDLGANVDESVSEPGAEAEESPDEGAARYLFVMAEFDPGMIEAPQYQTPPEIPETPGVAEEPPASEPATEPGPEAEASGPEGEAAGSEAEAAPQPPAGEAEAVPEGPPPPDETPDIEALQAERDRIIAENDRAREAYQQKLEEGRQRVKELNDRFADWYYVISNDVYEKIRLTRQDLVEVKSVENVQEG